MATETSDQVLILASVQQVFDGNSGVVSSTKQGVNSKLCLPIVFDALSCKVSWYWYCPGYGIITLPFVLSPRTSKQIEELCVPFNIAFNCTQQLQNCTYSYLVPFVTVTVTVRYLLLLKYNYDITSTIGLIARTVQFFAKTSIKHNFEKQHLQ